MKKMIAILLISVVMMTAFVGCKKEAVAPAETTTAAVDVVTTASLVDNGQAVADGLSAEGTWIVAVLKDITYDKEIVVDGLFYDKDDTTKAIYRKLALYAQDADRNVTASYKLTAPKMTVKSENFKIQSGTFIGDVFVEAKGFTLTAATIEGNVYYSTQEFMDSAVIDEKSKVTGKQEVK